MLYYIIFLLIGFHFLFVYKLIVSRGYFLKVISLICILNFYFLYLGGNFRMGVLFIEGFLIIMLVFGNIHKLDFNYFLFVYLLITLSFLSVSFLLTKSFYSLNIIFWILIFKSIVTSFFILVSRKLESFRFGILIYMLVSKSFIIFYWVLFKDFYSKEKILISLYSSLGVTIILTSWALLILVTIILLLSRDMEGYFLSIINVSHILILITCFFNYKIFLIALTIDFIFFLLFLILKALKINFIYNSSISGGGGSLMLFIFITNFLGIPPFPSFFLEVGFIYSFYYLFEGGIKIIFLVLVYFLIVLQFYIFFIYLGRLSNKPKHFQDLRSEGPIILFLFVGIFSSLIFQFFIFYGI